MNAEHEITVPVPAWMEEKLAALAAICEKSIDSIAAALFAAEVVHTRKPKKLYLSREVVHTRRGSD